MCLLMVMLVTSAAQAAPMTTNPSLPQSSDTGARPQAEVQEGMSPTTGLPSDKAYRPVVVQISNADGARPHWNMSEADIVYEAIYWGPAHTRYTAVYNDNHPAVVGAVRSARTMHLMIQMEWDAPFVFWGGQQDAGTNIYDFIRDNNINTLLMFDGVGKTPKPRGNDAPLYRETGRVSPHNAAVNLQMLVDQYWPQNENGTAYEPKLRPFLFSSTNPTVGTDTAQQIFIPYETSAYYPSYTYNAVEQTYDRSYNGEAQMDGKSGKRITAKNVIVQFADLTFYQNTKSRPVTELVGGGVMDAFINGQHIRGKWERNSLQDRTIFMDGTGNEIVLAPGTTFIQIIPTSMAFSYITNEGQEMTVTSGTDAPLAIFDADESEEELDLVEEGVI